MHYINDKIVLLFFFLVSSAFLISILTALYLFKEIKASREMLMQAGTLVDSYFLKRVSILTPLYLPFALAMFFQIATGQLIFGLPGIYFAVLISMTLFFTVFRILIASYKSDSFGNKILCTLVFLVNFYLAIITIVKAILPLGLG